MAVWITQLLNTVSNRRSGERGDERHHYQASETRTSETALAKNDSSAFRAGDLSAGGLGQVTIPAASCRVHIRPHHQELSVAHGLKFGFETTIMRLG